MIICIENSTEYPIIVYSSKPSCNSNKILKSVAFLNGNPLQYSCLENPMDGGTWWAAVHGVAMSRARLSDFTFTFTFLHWRRKWQPTPLFLPGESQGWRSWWASVYGVARVRHDSSDLAVAAAAFFYII